jgi:hypothetical protein
MNPINLAMFGVIGLVAYGYAAADQKTYDRYSERVAAVTVSEEAPADMTELNQRARTVLRNLMERQEANAASSLARCQNQVWPYYSVECLSSNTGASLRAPVRVVGADRHIQPAVVEKSEPVALAGWTQCTSQAWPYASSDCMISTPAAAQAMPIIGIAYQAQPAPRVTQLASADDTAGGRGRLPQGSQVIAMR